MRKARCSPDDLNAAQDALLLAERLYLSNLDIPMRRVLGEFALWVPTRNPQLATYFPESLHYTTFGIFEMAVRYWSCRILIIGLCRALGKMRLIFPAVMPEELLDAEEVQGASLILMSTQFAENASIPLSLGTFLMGLPLQLAFGTWWRFTKRHETASAKAQFLKAWCHEKSNEMVRAWRGEERTENRLEGQTSALEGGPLMSWMRMEVGAE